MTERLVFNDSVKLQIRLEAELAKAARAEAERRGTTVSALVRDYLELLTAGETSKTKRKK